MWGTLQVEEGPPPEGGHRGMRCAQSSTGRGEDTQLCSAQLSRTVGRLPHSYRPASQRTRSEQGVGLFTLGSRLHPTNGPERLQSLQVCRKIRQQISPCPILTGPMVPK